MKVSGLLHPVWPAPLAASPGRPIPAPAGADLYSPSALSKGTVNIYYHFSADESAFLAAAPWASDCGSDAPSHTPWLVCVKQQGGPRQTRK